MDRYKRGIEDKTSCCYGKLLGKDKIESYSVVTEKLNSKKGEKSCQKLLLLLDQGKRYCLQDKRANQ